MLAFGGTLALGPTNALTALDGPLIPRRIGTSVSGWMLYLTQTFSPLRLRRFAAAAPFSRATFPSRMGLIAKLTLIKRSSLKFRPALPRPLGLLQLKALGTGALKTAILVEVVQSITALSQTFKSQRLLEIGALIPMIDWRSSGTSALAIILARLPPCGVAMESRPSFVSGRSTTAVFSCSGVMKATIATT